MRGLTRRYAGRGIDPVVGGRRSVDLEIDEGTFVAIEGPSGSGKTTLLGLLAGLEAPDAGAITVLGHDLSRLSAAERARLRQRRIGIVFQSFGLIASLRAGENVALPLALAGVPEAERAVRAQAVLRRGRARRRRPAPGSTSCRAASASGSASPARSSSSPP